MSCFECIRLTLCCGLGCRLITSICDICKGVKRVEEEIKEDIKEKFDYQKFYFIHQEKDLYLNLKTNETVHLTIFENNKNIKKTTTL